MEISYWVRYCLSILLLVPRMKRAMAAVGLNLEDLTMKAYQLNPNAPLETSETMPTEFAASHGMTTEQAKAQFAHMESVGNGEGLRIDRVIIPTNTFSAHRLIKWSQKYLDKKDHALIMALYYSLALKNMPILRSFCVTSCYQEFALPPRRGSAGSAGDAFADEVKRDILEANQSGVWRTFP